MPDKDVDHDVADDVDVDEDEVDEDEVMRMTSKRRSGTKTMMRSLELALLVWSC